VALTFEQATIVIDEISSFLHPAAAKALLRIIQTNYAHHQYIIATHSPEVLSTGNPATVHIVRRRGYDSDVKRVDLDKVDQLREVADHLGVSMTDFFGAERIIWVEGRTEELCFPFIYEKKFGELPRGLILTSVIATGDFNVKERRE
jgi:predicted ATP-dependent endonuclease of OLD family